MKEIKLTRNKAALVDDSDFEWLNQWKWYALKSHRTFYAMRWTKDKAISMSRLILGMTDINIQADHRDQNGLNNQRYNLREATKNQNLCNRRPNKNCASKYKGVLFYRKDKNGVTKWRSEIKKNNKRKIIGYFYNEDEAALAYNKEAILQHGEFAYINHIT